MIITLTLTDQEEKRLKEMASDTEPTTYAKAILLKKLEEEYQFKKMAEDLDKIDINMNFISDNTSFNAQERG